MLFRSFFGQSDNYRVVGRYSEPRSAPPGFAVQAITQAEQAMAKVRDSAAMKVVFQTSRYR